MVQFRMTMQNGPEKGFVLQDKEYLQADFTWTCKNFTLSCEMVQKVVATVTPLISHDHAKLLSSCKMISLLLNSRSLNGEASERPLRWYQVSIWPWPINRNLNFSLKDFLDTFDFRIFYILSFNRILYFPSFSFIFSLAKHALWDQISKHEWLNLIFLRGRRI